jgi:hypothetical protein
MAKVLVNTTIEQNADGKRTICYMYNDNGTISYEYKSSGGGGGSIKSYITQELGDDENKVISQKAVTEALNKTIIQ